MVVVDVIVKLNAGKTRILKDSHGVLTVAVNAPAEDGKANQELIKFFSKKYNEPVCIMKGVRSRKKLLRIG